MTLHHPIFHFDLLHFHLSKPYVLLSYFIFSFLTFTNNTQVRRPLSKVLLSSVPNLKLQLPLTLSPCLPPSFPRYNYSSLPSSLNPTISETLPTSPSFLQAFSSFFPPFGQPLLPPDSYSKSIPPSMPYSPYRYWPRPQVPEPGGCRGGWGFHSQGCSVHSSHRLPWGLPLSAAAGCHPGRGEEERKKNQHVRGSHVNKFHRLKTQGLQSIYPHWKFSCQSFL